MSSDKPVSLTPLPDEQIVQQAVGQLPWGHNLALLSKLKGREERLAYTRKRPGRVHRFFLSGDWC